MRLRTFYTIAILFPLVALVAVAVPGAAADQRRGARAVTEAEVDGRAFLQFSDSDFPFVPRSPAS